MDPQSSLEIDDITGALCVFFSGNPFSDFAPFAFTIEGTMYASVEHYFQIQMLRSFGLFKLAMKLSTIFDANHFRRTLRQNLRSLIQSGLFDERMFHSWRATNAMRLLKKANRAKFEQNFDLKKHLLETGDRIVVFTTKHDSVLGIGMDEFSFLDWVRQQSWTIDDLLDNFTRQDSLVDGQLGRNLLGFSLMDIRAEISGQPSVLSLWKQRYREKKVQSGVIVVDLDEEEELTACQDQTTAAAENRDGETTEDPVGESSNYLTDDHILANLSNAEASVAVDPNESDGCDQSTAASAVVYRVPNEKRIVYRRPDYVHKVVCLASSVQEPKASESLAISADDTATPGVASSTNQDITVDTQTEVTYSVTLSDKRKAVLERLKALRFEKPLINPFSITTAGAIGSVAVQNETSNPWDFTSQPPVLSHRKKKIPRLCDIPPPQLPVRGNRFAIVYPELEPGEVPAPDYGPTLVPARHLWEFGAQRFGEPLQCISSASHTPMMPDGSASLISGPSTSDANGTEPGELWAPSSNPMKEIFESAKVGIKKLIENAKQSNARDDEISRLLLLRPPPIQGQAQARKRKGINNKKPPSYAGVIFNSKDAQMRHMSNRWVKGGRLTTTGKFEECGSDEEQEQAAEAEVGRTLRQLEAVPEFVDVENEKKPERPVQFHVVYEDTNEYADYVKWYGDVHGCAPSDVVDDEYQKYLRQWYRWYRTAVKFVDIEPLSDDGEDDLDGQTSSTDEEKSQLLMQQWRWQQRNEWELKARTQSSITKVAQETYSDGVSVSGKPVAYSSK